MGMDDDNMDGSGGGGENSQSQAMQGDLVELFGREDEERTKAWFKASRPADASEIAFTRPLFMSMVFFAGLAPLKTGAYGAHSTRAIVRAFAPAQRCRVRALCAYLASEVSL